MPGQQLIMHENTNIAGRNKTEKHDFSHIYRLVLLFIADSRKYHQILTLLNNNRWLKDN